MRRDRSGRGLGNEGEIVESGLDGTRERDALLAVRTAADAGTAIEGVVWALGSGKSALASTGGTGRSSGPPPRALTAFAPSKTQLRRPGALGGRRAASGAEPVRMIGTLNEGALHAQLKDWYRRPGDRLEEQVAGYVIDLVRGQLLVEIQTGGFAPLRRKLDRLTQLGPVRLVVPVALTRRIVRLSADGEVLSARRSPRRGRLEDVFARLVSIPALLCRPTFELEVVLTHEDELRAQGGARAYRRRGWAVVGRSLSSVEGSVRIAGPDDAARLLPDGLPERFDTGELAEAMRAQRRLAQQAAYCLRALGALEPVGKRGGSVLYALAEPGNMQASTSARPPVAREPISSAAMLGRGQ